jgi:Family of unknown function (DUF6062)
MSDIFSFELVDALASGECSLCYTIAADERRWLDEFWREGRRDSSARRDFFAGGGFCPRHAWILHELIKEAGDGAAIADVYGSLADRDLLDLGSGAKRMTGRRRARSGRQLRRVDRCAACVAAAEAEDRKAHFLVELLTANSEARDLYLGSAGLCLLHLPTVLKTTRGDSELQQFLLGDFRRRLSEVRERLSTFDRSRDHRFADQADETVARSLTDVVRLYVGEQP